MTLQTLSRRRFIQLTGGTAGGLMMSFSVLAKNSQAASTVLNETTLNAYLQINAAGHITLFAPNPEIGQGVKTALPMIIAEELDANWKQVTVLQSSIDQKLYQRQAAGGSMSVRESWQRLRVAGATAKHMLIQAAANYWQVTIDSCKSESGVVYHQSTKRQLSYGKLAELAGKLTPPSPKNITLKATSAFQLLGKRIGGVDNLSVVTGKPLFGIDQQPKNTLYATYIKAPKLGAIAVSANLAEIKRLPGIKDAFLVAGKRGFKQLQSGVAIVATSTWSAFKASEQLNVKWDESKAISDDLVNLQHQAQKIIASDEKGTELKSHAGDVEQALTKAAKTKTSVYYYSFLAHAPLEPMNTTAHYKNGRLEIWSPAQIPQSGLKMAARISGLKTSDITLHQTRVGGGFGRRLANDYISEAVTIAMKVDGPVKYIATREQDTTHDFYRPGGYIKITGGVNKEGQLSAWQEHFISFSPNKKASGPSGRQVPEFPLPLLNDYELSISAIHTKLPVGAYRAPVSNGVAFPLQSFLHEMSSLAKRDHLDFLLEILGEPRWLKTGKATSLHTGRVANILKLVAEKSNWHQPRKPGHGLGLAFYFSHATPVAEVVEVSVDKQKKITIHQVVVVADAGPIVNLSGAENQCQGAVLDALSSAMGQEIHFENGQVKETNFHDYPLQRMPGIPDVSVHFIESDFQPSGLGEPALPPFAPALCNAIFEVTGERITELPLKNLGYTI